MDEDEVGMHDGDDSDKLDDMVTGELTQAQKDYIREIYDQSDLNKNGTLSFKELRKALQLFREIPTVGDVKEIMKKHDIEGKKVTYEDFETIMAEEILSNTNPEFDLLEAFRVFDKDKSGTLDKKELKLCLQTLGEQMTDAECEELFDQLDTDKNGKLTLIEVSKLLV